MHTCMRIYAHMYACIQEELTGLCSQDNQRVKAATGSSLQELKTGQVHTHTLCAYTIHTLCAYTIHTLCAYTIHTLCAYTIHTLCAHHTGQLHHRGQPLPRRT